MTIGFLFICNFSEIHSFSDGSMWLLQWLNSEHTKNNFDPHPSKQAKLVKIIKKKKKTISGLGNWLKSRKKWRNFPNSQLHLWRTGRYVAPNPDPRPLFHDMLPLFCWKLRLTRINSSWVWLGGWGSLLFHLQAGEWKESPWKSQVASPSPIPSIMLKGTIQG